MFLVLKHADCDVMCKNGVMAQPFSMSLVHSRGISREQTSQTGTHPATVLTEAKCQNLLEVLL